MALVEPDPRLVAEVMALMEQLESDQLNFGINNTRVTPDFLIASVQKNHPFRTDAEVMSVLAHQLGQGEIVEVEPDVYRSRIAETARDIRLVRQRFFDLNQQPRRLSDSPELVEAIRTVFRPRSRPDRGQVPVEELLDTGGAALDSDIEESLRWMIAEGLRWSGAAGFQSRAFRSIYELSATPNASRKAVLVAGDTGSGKTEAFLFPILARIAQRKRDLGRQGIYSGVGAVLVYPRVKLALNQLGRIAKILKLWELYGGPRLTVGIQNTEVPSAAVSGDERQKKWLRAREWRKGNVPPRTVAMDLIQCPFEPPGGMVEELLSERGEERGAKLVFENAAQIALAEQGYPRLVSMDPHYWEPQSSETKTPHQRKLNNGVFDQMLVTKNALKAGGKDPELIPDILIITDKSLSLYLLQPEFQHLWGLWPGGGTNGRPIAPPRFLVLDEVHLLNGLAGAHLSRLVSRFQARVALAAENLGQGEQCAIPVGVSATLYDEAGFMAKILGISQAEAGAKIIVVKPSGEELKPSLGRERYIFVRPHEVPNPEEPEKRVGSMAAGVQIVMASIHNLMGRKLGANHQYKALAFFDSVNDVNLFEMFYNSPGSRVIRPGANTQRLWSIRTGRTCPLTDAKCIYSNTPRGRTAQYGACPYFLAGDCWVFAERWGWNAKLDVSHANYSGVVAELQRSHLIPTTPALEVGYDDDSIQLIYQHMAPNNVASFIQRRGRAGRNPDQSPVIVTMLWPYRARDLFYFYRPNYLYQPSFDDIPLNSRNRYVQLTHAFLSIFDWLAAQAAATGWLDITDERVNILSANFTTIGNDMSSFQKELRQYHKNRAALRLGKITNWGDLILDVAGTQLRQYLRSQYPAPAPDVDEEALKLLAEKFFAPAEHRIPDSGFEHNNFLMTFKQIDVDLQGNSGESVVDVTYPLPRAQVEKRKFLYSHEREQNPSAPLDRGLTELLPGNVTYRLRVTDESHWTPILAEGTSTYLYPSSEAEEEALGSEEEEEYSLPRRKESLLGVPPFLRDSYPELRYFMPKSLKAQLFRLHKDDPLWLYNVTSETTEANPDTSLPQRDKRFRNLEAHSQSHASSVIVPFHPENTPVSQSIQPPRQLDKIFAIINAYLDENIGYLQLFYEYTISPRLRKIDDRRNGGQTHPKLYRHFYGPHSTPQQQDPRMAAYEIHTQGLEFVIAEEFCRAVVLRILTNDDLRLYFRQQYVIYHVAKAAQKIYPRALPLRFMQLARLLVSYWLTHSVPDHPAEPEKWTISLSDLQAARVFAEGTEGELPSWCGEQSASILFDNLKSDEPADRAQVERFLQAANAIIQDGFTDSRSFREYLESVALHSLAVVVKNYCALLGGVLPESLVVYADLPGLERESQLDQPRILILDTVSGGSGAIGQAFENIMRRPKGEPKSKEREERNLWAMLQNGLGVCPVGEGEAILRRFLLGKEHEDAEAFIKQMRDENTEDSPAKLRAAIEAENFYIPDDATFATIARIIFADPVYVAASSAFDDDLQAAGSSLNGAHTSQADPSLLTQHSAIHPPLIVHELLRQEEELYQQLRYRPQPEIVVAQALKAVGSGKWPHIEKVYTAIRRDLETNREVPNQEHQLRKQMTVQLLGLLPRKCEDGCPVCLVNGSNIEKPQFAPYLNSRRMLKQIRDLLMVVSVPETARPVRGLVEANVVRFDARREQLLPTDLAGALKTSTYIDKKNMVTTTVVPAETIDAHGNRRFFSILREVAVNSQEEVMVANYLDFRTQRDQWDYEYHSHLRLLDPRTMQRTQLRPSFVVSVPYTADGEGVLQHEVIIEVSDGDTSEGHLEYRETKALCYTSAGKDFIFVEPNDFADSSFLPKIEEFIRNAILKREPRASVSFAPLE